MKKVFLVVAVLLISGLAIKAQVFQGDFSVLKDLSRVRMEFDFSQADIHGMTEEEFANYESDWLTDKPEVLARFLDECNKKCGNVIYVGKYKDSPYCIRILVHTITIKGDYDIDAILEDNEGKILGSILSIRERGGKFGTKLNLIKDGAEHTGELTGTLLKDAILKKPKNRL